MKDFAEVRKDSLGTIRVVRDGIKIYTTQGRAKHFGQVIYSAPCGGGWVALPFFASNGGIHSYYTEDEYARIFQGVKSC